MLRSVFCERRLSALCLALVLALSCCAALSEGWEDEDLWPDPWAEPLDPDSPEVLERLKQGLPTGLDCPHEFYSGQDRSDWGSDWELVDGVLYDTALHALLAYPNDKTDTEYHVEPGTLYIAAGALQYNFSLKEIWLPEGLLVIGRYSLCGQSDMENNAAIRTVHVPSSVELIASPVGSAMYSMGCGHPLFDIPEGHPRYRNADGLLIDTVRGEVLFCADREEFFEVTVPDGVRSIAPFAFSGAFGCVRVRLPEGLETIGRYAFSIAFNLGELNIPSTVTAIGEETFTHTGENYIWGELYPNLPASVSLPEQCVITVAPGAYFPDPETLDTPARIVFME